MDILKELYKRAKIDRTGVKSELVSAELDNAKLEGNFVEIGDNTFFNIESEQVFEITQGEHGKRMTRKITPTERKRIEDEINNTLPRA